MQSLLLLLSLSTSIALSAPTDPDMILKKVDAIRNPSESYTMTVQVTDSDSGKESIFDVSLSGNDRTLIKTVKPSRDRGRNLLMLDEEMWAYIPNLKRALRVSLSQKLTGQAANGDISRMRWSGDYTPTIEKSNDKVWQLHLKAKKKGLTYENLRVWVQKSTFRPIKAEFLSLTDKVLKVAKYHGYQPLAGQVRPSKITIQDALRKDNQSEIVIQSMEVKKIPRSLFHQRNLK